MAKWTMHGSKPSAFMQCASLCRGTWMPIAGILLMNLPPIMLELSMLVLLLSFPAAALPAASFEPLGSCLNFARENMD